MLTYFWCVRFTAQLLRTHSMCTYPTARADCAQDCRQPQFQLGSWPDLSILDPATGRYTRESDLCLLAELMARLPFALSDSGQHLRQDLATRQVTSAEAALQHAWLAAS